ncbi:MAG TPA: LuxR C-terminal-related transcriptional regulator [Flavobacteriales bacterium]|nr:LuxR C-terminal-related transcriptional regulator [Flavobacteriales bacterium]
MLGHLARGATSRQIAEALTLSMLTVNGHRRNMLKKSGLPNAAALVQHAMRQGWT